MDKEAILAIQSILPQKKKIKTWKKVLLILTGLILAFIIFVVGALSWLSILNFPGVGRGGAGDVTKIVETRPVADTVYVVRMAELSADEISMLTSLQGIVAQTASALVLIRDDGIQREYITDYIDLQPDKQFILLQKSGETVNPLDICDGDNTSVQNVNNVWNIVSIFKSYLKDSGFVTFIRTERGSETNDVNLAANISSIENWLSVPTGLRNAAIAAGLVEKEDLRELSGSEIDKQRTIFNRYKNQFNKEYLVHARGDWLTGRDLGIANKAFIFFTLDGYSSGFASWNSGPGIHIAHLPELLENRIFRKEVSKWANPGAVIFGFWDDNEFDTDEMLFIQDVTQLGNTTVPFQNNENLSFISAMEKVPVKQTPSPSPAIAAPGKHYVAFYLTDGDNGSWTFASAISGGFVADRIASQDTFKLSFTHPPLQSVLFPSVEAKQFAIGEAASGGNNYYFTGTSGLGCAYPSNYDSRTLADYARRTAEAMAVADMRVVGPMEFIKIDPLWRLHIKKPIEAFSQQDQIIGGIYQIDGDKYIGANGEIFWSANGKPFISAKYALWGAGGDVSAQDYADLAQKLNNGAKDPTTEDSYTVVCIQPWDIKYASFSEFVKTQLDDSVELVTVEELIQLVAANVKR
ncbi:MAG: hypothetical protein LBN25_00330 [Christensenellaceae bacterium]|jgi:hypothetical protein|nr:hypothetical protein [Christensenellaceae bacterium]